MYCVNCVASMCSLCDSAIHKSEVMDKHYRAYKGSSESHATEKAGIPINEEVWSLIQLNSLNLLGQVLCTEHPGEMSKLICRDCFVLICRECATLGEHSGHRVELVMHVATSLREVCAQWRAPLCLDHPDLS